MKICSRLVVALGFLLVSVHTAHAQDLPTVRIQNGASQLLLHGKPFLVLGGELGNSSAGTAAQADSILSRLAQLHVNTVLMPVVWDEIEPNEFYVLGSGLTVTFIRDPDVDDQIAGIANINQISEDYGKWVAVRQLNGGQSNQGRELSMDLMTFASTG